MCEVSHGGNIYTVVIIRCSKLGLTSPIKSRLLRIFPAPCYLSPSSCWPGGSMRTPLTPKVCSKDQQHQHHLGPC